MKDFETQYVRWQDGLLDPALEPEFLRELKRRGMSEADGASWGPISGMLAEHAAACPLENADFFSHSVMEKVVALAEPDKGGGTHEGGWFATFLGMPGRLAWAGGLMVALVAALYFAIPEVRTGGPRDDLATRILSAQADEPGLSVAAFEANDGAAVVWIEGLDYLPADHVVR